MTRDPNVSEDANAVDAAGATSPLSGHRVTAPGKVTRAELAAGAPAGPAGSRPAGGPSRSADPDASAGAGVWAADSALMEAMGLGPVQRTPLAFGGSPMGPGPRLGIPVAGARSPQLDAFKYFEKHGRQHFAELREHEMGALTLPTGSPYASWQSGDPRAFGRWFSYQLFLHLPAKPWDLLEQTLAPTNIWKLIDDGRDASNPDDPAQANEYQSAVTREMEKAYREPLREALARLMPRIVKEWNRRTLIDHAERSQATSTSLPEHPETNYPGVGVLQSHPIDRHVLAALSTVGAQPSLVKVDFTAYRKAFPTEAKPHGARPDQPSLRKLRFEWQAPQGARRWIKVIDPIDARPEEVAAELFGDSLLTYLVTPAAPLFGLEIQKHPFVPHHERTFSRFSGGAGGTPGQEALAGPLADQAALNQAAGLTAGKAPRAAVVQELEILLDELQALTAEAASWLTFDPALVQAIGRVEQRKNRLAAGDDREAAAWGAQVREQLEIVGKCRRGVEIVGKLYKTNAEDREGRELTWEIGTLFYQAAVHSDLVATARPMLDRANQRLLALPADWIEAQFRWIRRALAASRQNARTGKDDAFVRSLAAKEELLRGELMAVRDLLLSNPLAIRDELARLTRELQKLATAAATVRNVDACDEAFVSVKEAKSATGWIRSLASNPLSGRHGNDRLEALAQRANKFQAQWDSILQLWRGGKQEEAAEALEKHARSDEWKQFFQDVAREISDQAKYDAWMTFGMLVGIAVVTGFAGAVVEPLAAGLAGPILGFAITVTTEAALFTSLSYLLVEKHPTLQGLGHDFAKNVALFGVLKGVGKGWGALEKLLGVEMKAGEVLSQFAIVNGVALYEANREKAKRGETLTEGEILKISFDNLVFLLAVAIGSKAAAPAFGRWRLRGKAGEQLARIEELHRQVESLAAQAKTSKDKAVAERLLEQQRELLALERLFLESLQEITRKGWDHARQQGMTREQFDAVHAAEKDLASATRDLRTAEILATLEPVMAGQYLAEPGQVYEAARDHFLADQQNRGAETRGEGGLRSVELHLPDGTTLHIRERGEIGTDTKRVATPGGDPAPPRVEEVAKAHGIEPAQSATFEALYQSHPAELLHWLETLASQPGFANRLLALFGESALISFKPTGNGLLDLRGKLDIAPAKLATLSDADLVKLEKLGRNDKAPDADYEYFESTSTKGGKPGARLRFKARVMERAKEITKKLLADLELSPEDPRASFLENATLQESTRLWDLFNEEAYRNPKLRKQAAQWALEGMSPTVDRSGTAVREFVARLQFYEAEIRVTAGKIVSNTREMLQQRLRKERTIRGKELSPAEIKAVTREVTQEHLGRAFDLIGPAANQAAGDAAIEISGNKPLKENGARTVGEKLANDAWRGSAAAQTGDLAPGVVNVGSKSEHALTIHIQSIADTLSFSNAADAAYHAHKHVRELDPSSSAGNEVRLYLDAARKHIRNNPGVLRHNQNGSRSIVVEKDGLRAIVAVSAQGDASIATFGRGN